VSDLNHIFSGLGTTVFTVMSELAVKHEAINLGQGFPDVDGPQAVRQKAADILLSGPNQYAYLTGIPELRKAVAADNLRHYGLETDWQTEVMVTSGATQALTACLMALLNPGDEVVMIEPFYDCYMPLIERAGAVAKVVTLTPPQWELPEAELRAAFSDKTKLILLNSPMNPTGKVFTRNELELIASLVEEYDAYALCDEVYEHLTFGDHKHIPLMTLPGMGDRCLRIGSAGKTFSLTGWKVGYISGSASLLSVVAKAHQFIIFCTPPALQHGVAHGLEHCSDFYVNLAGELESKRDFLKTTLENLGLRVLPVDGTYFLTADITSFGFEGTDYDFCKFMTEKARVGAIPTSVFYHSKSPNVPHNLVRFCFCKRDEVLHEAAMRLDQHLRG